MLRTLNDLRSGVQNAVLHCAMRVLVGDDQPDVLEAARLLLKSGGHVAVTAGTPEAVLREARSQPFDLLLVDMNYARDTTSGRRGARSAEGLRASGVSAPGGGDDGVGIV
jgi:CheY-like chemotaxis protein